MGHLWPVADEVGEPGVVGEVGGAILVCRRLQEPQRCVQHMQRHQHHDLQHNELSRGREAVLFWWSC